MHPLTALRMSTVDRGAIESLDVQCGRSVDILLVPTAFPLETIHSGRVLLVYIYYI